MYTATVSISINSFQPINAGYVQATFSPPNNTSAPGSGGSKVFSGANGKVIVSLPKGYTGAVQIAFQLPDSNYVLSGIAVNPTAVKGGTSYGRQQLRSVVINRDDSGSQMIVTDGCMPQFSGVDYDFLILVQSVSGSTGGQVGAIDPDIDTQNEN